jgi:glycosyltransferase involved in cell wall biosynthesis
MLFTIAIPTFRRHELLCQAVLSAMHQKNNFLYEVLIVDNDPNSEFESILNSLVGQSSCLVRYIRNEANIGMYGNWNKCILQAKGQWMTILGDDDMLHEHYLDTISKYFNHEISCIDVGKKDFRIGENISLALSNRTNNFVYKVNNRLFDIFNPIGTPTGFAFRKELALKIGGYDQNFYPSADYKFAKDLIKHASALKIKGVYAFTGIGVNDSMKIDTLKSFYSRDLIIRNIRPHLVNKIIGVLNIVEQARKFSIKPSEIFYSHKFFDLILQGLGLAFRILKYIFVLVISKAGKYNVEL